MSRSTRHRPEFHKRAPVKVYCRVATTANITIATALNNGDTIDGVTLATGDRVLVKDQTSGSQNGIYVVGASPARAYDMDTSADVLGTAVYVIAGTTNAGKIFVVSNTSAITLDTTAITFAEFAPAATPYTSPLTDKGDLFGRSGTADARVPVGLDDYVLVADSSQAQGLRWKRNDEHVHAVGERLVTDGVTATYYLANEFEPQTVAAYLNQQRVEVTEGAAYDSITFAGVPGIGQVILVDYIMTLT